MVYDIGANGVVGDGSSGNLMMLPGWGCQAGSGPASGLAPLQVTWPLPAITAPSRISPSAAVASAAGPAASGLPGCTVTRLYSCGAEQPRGSWCHLLCSQQSWTGAPRGICCGRCPGSLLRQAQNALLLCVMRMVSTLKSHNRFRCGFVPSSDTVDV